MSSKSIKISLIISTYNWSEALELVFLSLKNQTIKPFELLIADDGSTAETKDIIDKYVTEFDFPIIHVWHEDNGFRKTIILNKTIEKAKGDYIIQIDGDCIMNKYFIKDHLNSSRKKHFIHGSRVLLNEDLSKEVLKSKSINFPIYISDSRNKLNAIRSVFLSHFFTKRNRSLNATRGCNFSFWKADIMFINGYNESMIGWGLEDTEVSARLINSGCKKIKLKLLALQYHIDHPIESKQGFNLNEEILKEVVTSKIVCTSSGILNKKNTVQSQKISAIIPTYNEEHNIQRAIESLKFADEILIIDSFSTDSTIKIVEKNKVNIIQRKFDDFSSQKNFAIRKAKYDWVFMLDADERLTKESINEILQKVKQTNSAVAYWMYRQNFFLNKKINYSGWQNDKSIKLFNRTYAKYNGNLVHEKIIVNDGKIGFLKNKLLHYTYVDYYSFKKKITFYSVLKAQELFKKKIKPNFFHFYIKPSYRYLYHYIFKLGFLDGKNGKIIASVNAYGVKNKYIELKKMYNQ